MDLDTANNEAGPSGTLLVSDGADGVISVPVAEGVDQVVLNSDQTTYIIQFVDAVGDPNDIPVDPNINPVVSTITTVDGAVTTDHSAITSLISAVTATEPSVTSLVSAITNVDPSLTTIPGHVDQVENTLDDIMPTESSAVTTVIENVESGTQTAIEQGTLNSQTDSAQELDSPDKPTVAKQNPVVVLEDIKHDKTKTRFGKALNLEPKNTTNANSTKKTNNNPVVKVNSEKKDVAKKKEKVNKKVDAKEKITEKIEESPRRHNRRSIKKPKRYADDDDDDGDVVETKIKVEVKPTVITLPRITKKNLGLKELFIEVEIEETLFVSALTKSDCEDGLCKYVFRVSKNAIADVMDVQDELHTESTDFTLDMERDEVEDNDDIVKESPVKKGAKRKKKINTTQKSKSKILGKRKKVEQETENKSAEPKNEEGEAENKLTDEEDNTLDEGNSEQTKTNVENEGENDKTNETEDAQNLGHIIKIEDSLGACVGAINIDKTTITVLEPEINSDSEQGEPTKWTKKKVKKKNENEEEEKNGKPKRKYTKRNVYQRDNINYTVKKSETGADIFKCDICGMECNFHGNIKDHVRTHTGEKPFECDICGRPFSSQSNLTKHHAVHMEERPFECHLCHFKFKIKRHLVRHLKRHSALGTHTCQLCGKQMYSSYELKNHISWHYGIKDHACDVCGKKFLRVTTLERHKLLHTGETKHQCDICGAYFARRDYFRSHLQKQHNVELSRELCYIPMRNRTVESQLYYASTDPQITSVEVEDAVRHIEEGGSIVVVHT